MTIFVKPISLYEVGSSGDRVYTPGIAFEFEQYNSAEEIQFVIHHRHCKVGTWAYNRRTGVSTLTFIEDFLKRDWCVETTDTFHTETVRSYTL
jgi:hypothetical protein